MKIIVIGSGVMGSGIASQVANAGFKVHLLDIVPKDAIDRNILAKQAITKIESLKPENIIPGNLEDDLETLKSADWVIEVIVEKLYIKQDLYLKLEQYCSSNCIISSNTSTIPLSKLIDGRTEFFKNNFLITHFFNPPRYMPLLELVVSEFTKKSIVTKVSNFLDIHLGKTIVRSNDVPGFIANRIGCYWLETALSLAIEMNMSVEEVDSLMSQPVGIPKTAVFGLYDLIGIDVMRLISQSLINSLPSDDDFTKISKNHKIVTKMIETGFTGRKGKGGFYKLSKDENGNKIKQTLDLATGEYCLSQDIKSPIGGIRELIDNNQYALKVLSKTLSYAASLVPIVSDNISDIDQAMKLGYNWKYGPFELIDMIGGDHLIQKLEQQKIKIPEILSTLKSKTFYQEKRYFNGSEYRPIEHPDGIIFLTDYNKIICQNESAKILDLGDDVAVIEITSKMAMLNHQVFELIMSFVHNHQKNFKAIIIANNQTNFSVGGNLQFMLAKAQEKDWQAIEDYLSLGQQVMLTLQALSIPVVAALKGMAFGGGSEMLLHSSGIVAHVEANTGLVEAGVGLIPSWGGCHSLIIRSKTIVERIEGFKNIVTGRIASSAYESQTMLQLDNFKLTMNSNRVLADSKALALKAKETKILEHISMKINWQDEINKLNLTGYDQIIAQELIHVFSANNKREILDLEREIFIKLLHNSLTQDRISYTLKNGKRLKN